MTRPQRLRPGQTVAIVAPAGPPDSKQLERGVCLLSEAGYNVQVSAHCLMRRGYLSGSDEQRADEFNNALRNPDVRAIFCARGGYGSARIVNLLDYATARTDPKIIVGFSDITTLLTAFYIRSNLSTFHGPMFSGKLTQWSFQYLLTQLTHPDTPFKWPEPTAIGPFQSIQSGTAEGPLFGGCLSILSTLIGTDYEPDTSGMILIFEETGEAPYRIDRSLTHLKNAQWLEKPAAIIFGQFENCIQRKSDPEPTLSMQQILTDLFMNTHYPVLGNAAVGHGETNFTFPLGIRIRIDESSIHQLESGVS